MQRNGVGTTGELQALQHLYAQYGVSCRAGETIVAENEPSYDLYVILRGQVQFSFVDPESGRRRVLRTAQAGEIFGEISCFSGLPRSATATAVGDVVLLRFQKDTAVELIRTSPQFAIRVIQTLGERLRANTELLQKVWGH